MKQLFTLVLVMSVFSLGVVGCAEKATVTKETKVSTPGGTTTVTEEKQVKQTGDNPPPVKK
jgi:hypothetical protein